MRRRSRSSPCSWWPSASGASRRRWSSDGAHHRSGAARLVHGTEAVSDLRHALCDDPNVLVPEILAEWQGIAQEEPWLELPEQHRFNSLPDVTYGLLDVA